MAEVLVLVDHAGGQVRKTTSELLTIARRLGEPSAVYVGDGYDEAKATLTALAERLKGENKNVYLEIRGHTDNYGGRLANRQLGRERAANTARFLADQGVPGNKMQLGSWGEDTPTATEKTAEARAENRRVEIVVYS